MTHNYAEVKPIVETILAHLAGVTPTDAGWKARCPAHEDKKASLSVSVGASGKILVHCHAGCTVESVLSAIGLTRKDLFPKSKLDSNRKASKHRDAVHKPAGSDDVSAFSFAMTFAGKQVKPSHVWPYHTSSGEVAFIVARYEVDPGGKEIRPWIHTSRGWMSKAHPAPRPLFNLVGIGNGSPIFVVEGEKCAEILLKNGLHATTSSGGSNAARQSDWSSLRGKDIVVLPDNDEPGRKYAKDVAGILHGLQCKVKIVSLPGLAEREDVHDWFTTYQQTTTVLLKLVDQAEFYVPKENAGDESWEEPTDLTRPIPPAPAFPMECLPYRLANYARDESERMQAAVDLIAIPMLVTCGGLIGKDASIRPKKYDDWSERACLWGASIAPPASLKSQTLSRATAPLRRLQGKLSEEHVVSMKKWKLEQEAAELRENEWRRESKNLLKKNPEAVLPPKPEGSPPAPIPGRIFTVDSTLEKLCDLQINSRGMSLVRDELAGFLLNMTRYTNGSDRQFYLECHSGGSYAIDRVGRGESFISDLYLNVYGTIQPTVARRLFSIDSATVDGFFDRFGLLCYPQDSPDYNHVDRWPDANKRNLYNDVCDRLFSAKWHEILETNDGKEKPFCRFDSVAQDIFDAWLCKHMNSIRSKNGESDPISGLQGKARGLLARLCLVIHLTAWAAGEMPDAKTIEPQSLERAILLLETYLIPMWHRVCAEFGQTNAEEGAHRIAKWLLTDKPTEITLREVKRKHWSGLLEQKEIQASFDILIDHAWLSDAQSTKTGGRPLIYYQVNPRIYSEKKANDPF